MSKLTAKQEAFCQEYLIDLNATQAAIRAGYSEKTSKDIGCENLAKPNVAERIAELKAERSERTKIDADWVLKASQKLFNRCMEGEPVTDAEGKELGLAKFHPAGAAKAIELIGRHVAVKAFEEAKKASDESLADSVNKLIDKLPS